MANFRGTDAQVKTVNLPYDAMIHEKRNEETPAKVQSGYYPEGKYTYVKKWNVPEEGVEQTIVFEFEGVYGDTQVFINGDFAGGNHNGYTNFYIYADSFLCYCQPKLACF